MKPFSTIYSLKVSRLLFSLSLRFNGHLPGEPGLAGVYWSKGWWRWWWQLDYWSCKVACRAKLQSNHHHQQTDTQFFYRPDALTITQPTVSKHGLAYPKLTWGLPTCLWPIIAPGYLGGGLPCLSSALWCQYPKLLIVLLLIISNTN